MSKSFYEDGELPDDIAAQLEVTETEKPKRKRDEQDISVLGIMTGCGKSLTIFLLACVALVLFICSLVGTNTSRIPVNVTVSTRLPNPTITPGGVLDNMPMCTEIPVSRQGFMVIEISLPGLNSELIRTNLAGESRCRLTRNNMRERTPAISPDGNTILYAAGDGYQSSLRRMNSDGSDDREISSYGADPAWSPDGQQVVFPVTGIRAADINTGRLDGELVDTKNILRDNYQREFNDLSPDWSPDGKTIVFLSDRDSGSQETSNLEVYVIQPDGTALQRLTSNGTVDTNPVWLPDGRIAFLQLIPNGFSTEIFIMNASSTEMEQITDNKGIKLWLAASPDGSYLYYVEGGSIYRLRIDESYAVNLVAENVSARSLDVWTPQ